MSGFFLACVAAATVVALMVLWNVIIDRVKMKERRWMLNPMAFVGIALGIAALTREPGIFGGMLAGASILLAVSFVGLGVLAPQSKQTPAVVVGSPLPDFTAPDENGKPFELASLRGRPVLLKFFRGHW
jgi:hypothetical protein